MRHGDLFHDEGHYQTIQGPAKIAQDLRCQILESMGSDDLHPEFGSTLDGGTTPEGLEVKGVITTTDFNNAAMYVEAEVRRIEREYQERQLSRMNADIQTYGRTTLRRDEVLDAIGPLEFHQVGDTLFVQIRIIPISGIPEIIDLPIVTA